MMQTSEKRNLKNSSSMYIQEVYRIVNDGILAIEELNSAIKSKMFGDLKFNYPFYMNHQIMLE